MLSLQTTLIAAAVALIIGFGAGWKVKAWQDDSAQLAVAEHATTVEHQIQVGANKATSTFVEGSKNDQATKAGLPGLVAANVGAPCRVLPVRAQVSASRPGASVPAVPGGGTETAGAAPDPRFAQAASHDLAEAVDLSRQLNWLIDLCIAAHCDMETAP